MHWKDRLLDSEDVIMQREAKRSRIHTLTSMGKAAFSKTAKFVNYRTRYQRDERRDVEKPGRFLPLPRVLAPTGAVLNEAEAGLRG